MNCDALRNYLRAMRAGGFGWSAEYERTVAGGNYPQLAGHYAALLSQVLDLVPPYLLDTALSAAEEQHSSIATADRLPETTEDMPCPKSTAEWDGSISGDWNYLRARLLSLNVNRTGELAFTWINGPVHGHGVVHFDGKTLSSVILHIIASVCAADANPVTRERDAILDWWEGVTKCHHRETVTGLARDCLPCLREAASSMCQCVHRAPRAGVR